MPQIGLIGGTVFFGVDWFSAARRMTAHTKFGDALLLITDRLVFLPRHGLDEATYVMPHLINHAANFTALKEQGVEQVISVNSCGSLQGWLKPGMLAVPEDFISLFNIPSVFQTAPGHVAPCIDPFVRARLFEAASSMGIEVNEGGVYWQNPGPRLETKAEIRMMRRFADIVGMTMGSEAAVACELEMRYGAICSIDNFAHGLVDEPLTEKQIREAATQNAEKIISVIDKYLHLFGEA